MNSFLNKVRFYSLQLRDFYRLRKRIKKIAYRGTKEGCVVFNTVGCVVTDLNPEHYLAYLMACEGFKVKILMDDFQMAHWDYFLLTKSVDDYKFHRTLKNRVLRGGYGFLSNWVFRHPNIEIIWYSDILARVNTDLSLNESDKNHAESSVRKYFQSGGMDPSNKDHLDFLKICLENCAVSKKVGVYVGTVLKPNLYINSHGFYSVWGPAHDYLKNQGTPCLTYYSSPYRRQQLLIYDTTIHFMTSDQDWISYQDHAITSEDKKTVDHYFAERFKGREQDTSLYYKNIESFSPLKIKKENTLYTFALFTNVIWDSDVLERNTLFKSPIDWVLSTIEFFRTRPKFHLVLRFHPAEATYHTYSNSLEQIIRKRVPDLSEIPNITIISSHDKVNTYDLIKDNVDVGLVFDGMIALELAYLGIPLVLTAQGRNLGAGIAFEPKTKDEYLEMISDPEKLRAEFKNNSYMENLYRYANWYLFDHCFKLPILSNRDFNHINSKISAKEMDPLHDLSLLRTVSYLSQKAKPTGSKMGNAKH